MISTGNLQVDYAITYIVRSLYTLSRLLLVQFNLFLINYPQIASVFLIVGGAIASYYLIKNFLRIVYTLILTVIKLFVVLTLVFLGLWIYVRGIDTFTSDCKTIVDFTTNFYNNNGTSLEYEQQAQQQAKTAWSFLVRWIDIQ